MPSVDEIFQKKVKMVVETRRGGEGEIEPCDSDLQTAGILTLAECLKGLGVLNVELSTSPGKSIDVTVDQCSELLDDTGE